MNVLLDKYIFSRHRELLNINNLMFAFTTSQET